MNYKESKKIFEEIKKANKVILNCHRGPDPDSIGSALAVSYILKKFGKEVTIICPSKLDERLAFLSDYGNINYEVDFSKFNYEDHDLLIALDSSSWDMVSDNYLIPDNIKIVVIDHHWTNTRFGKINLVDDTISSVGELLYKLFDDWKVRIDKDTATALLSAIIGDTGVFKYTNTTSETLKIAGELLKLGADKDKIVYELFKSYDANLFCFAGDVLKDIKLDTRGHFVWVAVPFRIYKKWGKPPDGKEFVVSLFAQSTKDTDFGFFILEKDKGKYSISFRARDEKIDVSKLAVKLGGGGHAVAAGGGSALEGMNFDKAVVKTLREARKFAKENLKK